MILARSDLETIKKWINDHWKDGPFCPICHNNSWAIGRTIVELRPKSRDSHILNPHNSGLLK